MYSHLLSTLSIDLIHRMDELHRKYKNNNGLLTIEIGDGGSVGNKNVRITKNECGCLERMQNWIGKRQKRRWIYRAASSLSSTESSASLLHLDHHLGCRRRRHPV